MALEFEVAAPGFDLDNAYFLAKACELARDNPGQRKARAVEQFGLLADSFEAFDVVKVQDEDGEEEEGHDYHGFLGATADIVVLAYGDVDNLEPWLKGPAVVQKPGYSGLIHTGFAEAFETIWKRTGLENHIRKQVTGEKGLWITGHGLGAALAILTAARLSSQEINVKEVYTFGAPRVGDDSFYWNYNVRTYRFVNNNDIIAHVPAELVPLAFNYCTYRHVGTLRYFDRHKQLGEGTSNWCEKKRLIQQQLLKMGQPPSQWFYDHLIGNYVEAIEANL